MRIGFRLWNDGRRSCATARHRGWNIIEELVHRGVDALAWQPGEKVDVLIVQRAAQAAQIAEYRRWADQVWVDVNDDYIGPGRADMGFPPELLQEFDGVLVCSDWLRVKCQRLHGNVHWWPEAVDPIFVPEQCAYSDSTTGVRVAWMGGTDNLGWFGLSPIRWVLHEVAARYDFTWVVAVPEKTCRGAGNEDWARGLLPGTIEFHVWEYETLGRIMASCDCSIIPLEQTSWCWAKSDNKPASLMWMGLPIVCEDIRCYEELAPHALVAYQADEWAENLMRIVREPDLRRELGRAGQAWAQAERSAARVADLLLERIGA